MRSEKQREASRQNGAKSKGPTSPGGKAISRFNGLKHGLRAEQVILPGEDPAEYEAEKRAWFDDWKPASHTRAFLVERAAQAAWRLRRSVRAEAALLRDRADTATSALDVERLARVERAIGRIGDDPKGSVTLLELDATGLDRLLASWGELAEALGRGPAAWDRAAIPRPADAPARPLHPTTTPPGVPGRCRTPRPGCWPPTASAGAHSAAARTSTGPRSRAWRGLVAENVARPWSLRERAEDPADRRRRAADAAFAEATASEESRLRLRYEMALDRSLRATLNQLVALEKSGADLGEEVPCPEDGPPDAPGSPPASATQVSTERKRLSIAASSGGRALSRWPFARARRGRAERGPSPRLPGRAGPSPRGHAVTEGGGGVSPR